METLEINLPQYTIDSEPNYDELGKLVDEAIEQHLKDGKYIVRAVGLEDHKISLDELVDRVVELGTDKYDPNRKSVVHDDFRAYDYDIQACLIEIRDGRIVKSPDSKCKTFFGEIIYDFYNNAIHDRGYSVRIDLLLIYDPSGFIQASVVDKDAPLVDKKFEQYLFKFKEPEKKREALIGIIKVLR